MPDNQHFRKAQREYIIYICMYILSFVLLGLYSVFNKSIYFSSGFALLCVTTGLFIGCIIRTKVLKKKTANGKKLLALIVAFITVLIFSAVLFYFYPHLYWLIGIINIVAASIVIYFLLKNSSDKEK